MLKSMGIHYTNCAFFLPCVWFSVVDKFDLDVDTGLDVDSVTIPVNDTEAYVGT